MIGRRALLVTALGVACIGSNANATVRLSRVVGADHGVHAASATSLALDRRGYLWLGTYMGLARYDGNAALPWASETIRGEVHALASSPTGVFAANDVGLFQVDGSRAERVPGPDDGPKSPPRQLAWTPAGLWANIEGQVWLRDPAGNWSEPIVDAMNGEHPLSMMLASGELFISTPERLLSVEGARVSETVPEGYVTGVAHGPEGLMAITAFGRVVDLADDAPRVLYSRDDRGNALIRRGPATWALFDTAMVRLGDDGTVDVTEAESGSLLPGRPALLDDESSLWSVTFRGLHQLPEPETVHFGAADGLPSSHTRFVGPGPAGQRLVSTWQRGVGQLQAIPRGWRGSTDERHTVKSNFCVDGEGSTWAVGQGELLRWGPDGLQTWPHDTAHTIGRCTVAADGTVWLATAGGVTTSTRVMEQDAVAPRPGPFEGGTTTWAWVDGDTLFAAQAETVCFMPRDAFASSVPPWQCETLEGIDSVRATASVRRGDTDVRWIGTARGGVLERREGAWRPVELDTLVAAPRVEGLETSPRGGVWILGPGSILRVEHDGAGWVERERLGLWHGLLDVGATGLHEDEDGTLWLATSDGVVRMPSTARDSEPVLPAWGQLEVDGAESTGDGLTLRSREDRSTTLRFTATALRDPRLLEARMKRDGEPWTAVDPRAEIHLIGLAPGRHTIDFEVSYDGQAWARAPTIHLDVRPTWWRAPLPWFLLFASMAAAAAGWRWSRPLVDPRHLRSTDRRAITGSEASADA